MLTGIYTMLGGLLAVVWTESVQTVLLLVGAVVHHGGRLCEDRRLVGAGADAGHPSPPAGRWRTARSPAGTGNFLNMARGAGDPSGLPWYSILLGYPVLGIWYWCCDQTIVQRVLAAQDEKHARLGPLFCAFLKILPVFFFVLPGVICVALVQQNAFGGAAPQTAADTYTFMHHAPAAGRAEGPGGRRHAGRRHADLLGRAQLHRHARRLRPLQAAQARHQRPPAGDDRQDHHGGRHGPRHRGFAAVRPLHTIFEGINKLISYVAPPITAVFLLGVFWKRASGKSAFITLVAGMAAGLRGVLSGLEQHLPRRLHADRLPAAGGVPV